MQVLSPLGIGNLFSFHPNEQYRSEEMWYAGGDLTHFSSGDKEQIYQNFVCVPKMGYSLNRSSFPDKICETFYTYTSVISLVPES